MTLIDLKTAQKIFDIDPGRHAYIGTLNGSFFASGLRCSSSTLLYPPEWDNEYAFLSKEDIENEASEPAAFRKKFLLLHGTKPAKVPDRIRYTKLSPRRALIVADLDSRICGLQLFCTNFACWIFVSISSSRCDYHSPIGTLLVPAIWSEGMTPTMIDWKREIPTGVVELLSLTQ